LLPCQIFQETWILFGTHWTTAGVALSQWRGDESFYDADFIGSTKSDADGKKSMALFIGNVIYPPVN
jgi:hypothetical protein